MRFARNPSYDHLLYAGGWLLAPRGRAYWTARPRSWCSVELAKYELSFPSRAPMAQAGIVTILGRPVDPWTGLAGAKSIAKALLMAWYEGRFFDSLDQLSGRFLVIVDSEEGPRIYQDAVGARPVFYKPPVAASHSALAHGDPEALDNEVAEVWSRTNGTRQGVRYLPGIRAPHVGVRMLTPNTSVHVTTGRVERFWPRRTRRESTDLDRLAGQVTEILPATVTLASRSWPLAMSLTAGLDSRLVLAACRQLASRMEFFSHINPADPRPGHQVDLDVARDMAVQLRLAHRVYMLGEPAKGRGYDEFRRVWHTNMGIARGIPTLMKNYVDSWPRGMLHLRSNVAEIGRVFYKGERLAEVSAPGLTRWWNPELRDDPACVDSFAEFCEIAQFADDRMLGYDPLDLFYWEHRMGSWHAWLCMEADVAHDTFPAYSNRRLLDTMLSAPFDDRVSATVFHRAIDLMWPRVAEWPINPKRWPPKDK